MGNMVEFLYSKFLQSEGVSIDTRTLSKGQLFFALSGPNFNGNRYAEEALEKGASFAIVDDAEFVANDRTFYVDDSLKSLQELSVFHRERFRGHLIGLTGSNGKTTTKELLNHVLLKKYLTHSTSGNLNNHIGVPLTLLGIHPQVEIAIIEMGASKVGDIKELCDYANPTHGLITNIGHAHTETFGGIEGVLRGKSELFEHLRQHDGLPFINIKDHRLANMARRFDDKVLYPAEDVKLISADPYIVFELRGAHYQTMLVGDYNFINIAAAISLGRFFEVDDLGIAEAICEYEPTNWRSQVVEKERSKVIIDAYNANPDSMRSALISLSKMTGNKTAILGDMLELDQPEAEHRSLGKFLSELGLDAVIFVGELMRHASEELPGSLYFNDTRALKETIPDLDLKSHTVLLKGSRKMKLEEIADLIS